MTVQYLLAGLVALGDYIGRHTLTCLIPAFLLAGAIVAFVDRESWWFVRLIFPLLIVGVFNLGVTQKVLPEDLVRNWIGGNSLRGNLVASLIGAVSYFATKTIAPFVDSLMKKGMGSGPALALLLTGTGLSLPNWFAIARVFGYKKAVAYVLFTATLATLVAWMPGNSFLRPQEAV